MKTQATAKFVGTSSRKTGLVAALIRGRRATDAQTILRNTDKRATGPVGKVLASAMANAENNHNARPADLIVESVLIGPGPSLKRSRPRAKGSASPIKKRSSHITVVLTDGKSASTLVSSKAVQTKETNAVPAVPATSTNDAAATAAEETK
jgi:large subunit ribosomal protein L22